jgi:hypothetical protein
MHYSKGKVLMNSNVWNEWYDDKKTQGKKQVEQWYLHPFYLQHIFVW